MPKTKQSASRKYLKILGIVTIVFAVISVISMVVLMFTAKGIAVDQILSADQLKQLHDANLSDDVIRMMIFGFGAFAGLIALLEGWLMVRASNDPVKSTFLLVLIVLSVISGAAQLFSDGFGSRSTALSNIFNLTINVLAMIAVLKARAEVNA